MGTDQRCGLANSCSFGVNHFIGVQSDLEVSNLAVWTKNVVEVIKDGCGRAELLTIHWYEPYGNGKGPQAKVDRLIKEESVESWKLHGSILYPETQRLFPFHF